MSKDSGNSIIQLFLFPDYFDKKSEYQVQKDKIAARARRWYKENLEVARERRRARDKTYSLKKAGILPHRSSCAHCGTECDIEYHHVNYSFLDMVVGLCKECHVKADKLRRQYEEEVRNHQCMFDFVTAFDLPDEIQKPLDNLVDQVKKSLTTSKNDKNLINETNDKVRHD